MSTVEQLTEQAQHSFWNAAARTPDKTAVIEHETGRRLSFAELAADANRLSRLFEASGAVPRESTVLAALENTTDFYAVYLAAMQNGMYFVPVSPHSTTQELTWIVEDARPAVMVASGRGELGIESVRAAGTATVVFAIEPGGAVPALTEVLDSYDGSPLAEPSSGSRLLYTGGTTGRPKGVRGALPEISINAVAERGVSIWAPGLGMAAEQGSHLVCCPLYHGLALGMSTVALNLGNTLVVMRHFRPEEFLTALERHRVASTAMVPTMISRLLERSGSGHDVSSLRALLHGGSPCAPTVKWRALEWLGDVLYEFYGASEAMGTTITPQQWRQRPGSVGLPLRGADIKVVDPETGDPRPAGEIGEVLIRSAFGPMSFTGSASVRPGFERWPHYASAGDIGYLDDGGYLFLTDRVADIIVSGGVNVYSARVEAELLKHPDVTLAGVVGEPHPDWGEQVVAVVVPVHGVVQVELVEQLHELSRGSLSPAQQPKRIEIREELPLTKASKVDKALIRRELRERIGSTGLYHPPPVNRSGTQSDG
jgi:long-chain acyl-CoA synthetase